MLKKITALSGLMLLSLVSVAFAQDIVPISTDEFLMKLWQFVGGVKGMQGLVLAAAAVQTVMLFFRSPLSTFAGKYRLLIVLGLSVIASIVGLMSQGLGLVAALVHGTTLAAGQVLAHQVYKQFIIKADEVSPAPAPAEEQKPVV